MRSAAQARTSRLQPSGPDLDPTEQLAVPDDSALMPQDLDSNPASPVFEEEEPLTPRTVPKGPLDVNTANPMEVCTDGGGTVLAGEDDPFLVEIVDPGRRSGPQASLLEQGVAMGSQGRVGTEAGMDAATLGNKVPGGLSKLGYASRSLHH